MIRIVFLYLLLAVLIASCVTTSPEQRGKVLCPACGTEFDAIYQKRF